MARRAAKAAAKLGLALEPDDDARKVTVSDTILLYQNASYPDKRGRPRALFAAEKANYRSVLCSSLTNFVLRGFQALSWRSLLIFLSACRFLGAGQRD